MAQLTQQGFVWVETINFLCASLFLLVLIPLCYNIYFYVYKQQRYRFILILIFYSSAFVLCVTRCGNYFYYFAIHWKLRINPD